MIEIMTDDQFEEIKVLLKKSHQEIKDILHSIYEDNNGYNNCTYSCECEDLNIYIHIDKESIKNDMSEINMRISFNNSQYEVEPITNSRTIVLSVSICEYENTINDIINELIDDLESHEEIEL
jgi:hypothetical protein